MKRGPGHSDTPSQNDTSETADADTDHFARAMADVVPLPPDRRGRVRTTRPLQPPPQGPAPPPSGPQHDEDGSDAGYVAHGVDRRELRRLKRGDHTATDRLDLHGQTAAEALAQVKQFIDTRRHRHRAVCIVHGRGLHSDRNISVLKTRVRKFLREHPAVLAYADAPRTDGGAGAVYVLLRR